MGWPPGGRDLETMSRPGRFDWAMQGGRDKRPRPGCYARDLRWLCKRPGRCPRSSAHDMSIACAVCLRPGLWVCAQCTQPSFDSVHCLHSLFGHCSWTLFTSTVHRVKKKNKNFKNFLVYDLIYKIFILKLL